jgi:hypothetical protein
MDPRLATPAPCARIIPEGWMSGDDALAQRKGYCFGAAGNA